MNFNKSTQAMHLGDAVTAQINEYGQLELRTCDSQRHVIYLEPEVWENLLRFSESTRAKELT